MMNHDVPFTFFSSLFQPFQAKKAKKEETHQKISTFPAKYFCVIFFLSCFLSRPRLIVWSKNGKY